ncbi:MAG: hypothetical protein CXZ00_13590 [Acidobacteria bacterium]|nr:MAG: hypothetical protein CXZ00_13590 [Acidobacteriota bacterium]
MSHPVRNRIGRVIYPVVRRAARSYIAGPELNDALVSARALAVQGRASTLAFWDETGTEPADVLNACLESLQALQAETFDGYLSVKAPSLQYSCAAFQRIVDKCQCKKTRLHFDSLGPDSVDPTWKLIGDLLSGYAQISCTLPGRWKRSQNDADWAIERGLGVRVVKGQWTDPAMPRFDPHKGFLEVIERLAGRAPFVAVATHNPSLAEPALARLLKAGTPCELELLFGLPSNAVLRIAAKMGVRTRVYVPYGYGWLPYSLSQASKNPMILFWMLKDALFKKSIEGI